MGGSAAKEAESGEWIIGAVSVERYVGLRFRTHGANYLFPAPAKPKLVARAAGRETSPWKIKKDAPKLSAKDVPGVLRPLMSCALWCLHESIERNDPNQLFLLSNQGEIRSVAQKLNIIVRSCKEVGAIIASRTCKTGLDTFGDLEREFGVQQKSTIAPPQDAEEANGEKCASNNADGNLKDVDAMNHSVTSEGTTNTEASSSGHEQDLKKQSLEREEESLVNCDRRGDRVKEQGVMAETAATLVADKVSKMPETSVESIKSLEDSTIQQDSQQLLSEAINGLKLNGNNSLTNLANPPALQHSAARPPPTAPLPQFQSVDSVQHVEEIQTISDTSPSKDTITPSTSTMETTQDPEDSDEEVVVFVPQPKRLSAQQKPGQQSSRPSTPKEQSQQKPAGQSPQKSWGKPQPKGKALRHSPNPSVVGQAHPQPVNSPTVIDPDAFGRDFRVNLNPSPRLPHNPNGHPNQRNRGNMQNAPGGHVARKSPRQLARTSPPRNAPQENLQRLTPVPGPVPKGAPNHRRQSSRTSPRRGPSPRQEEVTPSNIESRATTAAGFSKSAFPGPQTVGSTDSDSEITIALPDWNRSSSTDFESATAVAGPVWNQSPSTDFVPGSALSNTELKPGGPGPRIYDASEFVPRPSRPAREFKPRPPKSKVFEAAEFVPRDFVPRTSMPRVQPKQHSPEPEIIEPRPSINDVDYVLKSGSTRASARGKGRLWTPS